MRSREPKQGGLTFALIDSAVARCAQLAQRHPRLWKLAWDAIHRLPFLLPHDKSYRALRHFIALKPEGLFLDVGANDGISALSFRRFSKSYRILSLEPNALLEPALKKLKASDPHFDYRMIGAGAVAGRTKFLFLSTGTSSCIHSLQITKITSLLRLKKAWTIDRQRRYDRSIRLRYHSR